MKATSLPVGEGEISRAPLVRRRRMTSRSCLSATISTSTFCGSPPLAQRIYSRRAACAVTRDRQETHRILLEACHLLGLRRPHAAVPYVRGAILLRKVVERLAVGCPYGLAVLTLEVGLLGVGAIARQRADPHVARNRGLLVLAPRVLVTLAVVVYQTAALAVDPYMLHGQRREEMRDARPASPRNIPAGTATRGNCASSAEGMM